jgi:hypothetical protein
MISDKRRLPEALIQICAHLVGCRRQMFVNAQIIGTDKVPQLVLDTAAAHF